jgi:hypothetical protein
MWIDDQRADLRLGSNLVARYQCGQRFMLLLIDRESVIIGGQVYYLEFGQCSWIEIPLLILTKGTMG